MDNKNYKSYAVIEVAEYELALQFVRAVKRLDEEMAAHRFAALLNSRAGGWSASRVELTCAELMGLFTAIRDEEVCSDG